ncbi:MAG: hypothetical protein ACKOF3_00060, partial [Spartobacteria bacterium]
MRRLALLAAAALALAGCGTPEKPTHPSTLRETQIEWLGNQCYRFTSSTGFRGVGICQNGGADGR